MGSRDAERGKAAVVKLTNQGLDVQPLNIDLDKAESIEKAVAEVDGQFGRLDVLVNNAGIMIDSAAGTALALDQDSLMRTLTTNAIGPFFACKAAIPVMRKNDYGRIVNMASTLGSLADMTDPASPYFGVQTPAYRLSKTLLNGVTAIFARETRGSNILVNSACPGWVKTDMGGDQAPLSVEQGADTPVWLATLSDDGPSGGFFRERRLIPW
jgi:NAD(P)-dependent dehydrogenase (short-subunit alcohol dehydrogenase family)